MRKSKTQTTNIKLQNQTNEVIIWLNKDPNVHRFDPFHDYIFERKKINLKMFDDFQTRILKSNDELSVASFASSLVQ